MRVRHAKRVAVTSSGQLASRFCRAQQRWAGPNAVRPCACRVLRQVLSNFHERGASSSDHWKGLALPALSRITVILGEATPPGFRCDCFSRSSGGGSARLNPVRTELRSPGNLGMTRASRSFSAPERTRHAQGPPAFLSIPEADKFAFAVRRPPHFGLGVK